MEHDVVRLIDLLFLRRQDDDTIEKIEITDDAELNKLGAVVGAFIGYGAAGEEGAEVGAEARRRRRWRTARSSARRTSGTWPTPCR